MMEDYQVIYLYLEHNLEHRADLEDFFFPVLSPGWISHFLWNDYYQTDEEYFYAIADFVKGEYEAVVEAGLVLQIDDPSMVTRYG